MKCDLGGYRRCGPVCRDRKPFARVFFFFFGRFCERCRSFPTASMMVILAPTTQVVDNSQVRKSDDNCPSRELNKSLKKKKKLINRIGFKSIEINRNYHFNINFQLNSKKKLNFIHCMSLNSNFDDYYT